MCVYENCIFFFFPSVTSNGLFSYRSSRGAGRGFSLDCVRTSTVVHETFILRATDSRLDDDRVSAVYTCSNAIILLFPCSFSCPIGREEWNGKHKTNMKKDKKEEFSPNSSQGFGSRRLLGIGNTRNSIIVFEKPMSSGGNVYICRAHVSR